MTASTSTSDKTAGVMVRRSGPGMWQVWLHGVLLAELPYTEALPVILGKLTPDELIARYGNGTAARGSNGQHILR